MLTNKEAWKILSFAAILTSTQCQTPIERLLENDLKLHVTNVKSVLVSEKQHLSANLKTTQIDDKAFFYQALALGSSNRSETMPLYDKPSHHQSDKGLRIEARRAKRSLPDLADSAIFQIVGLWMLLAGLFGIYFRVILKYLHLCLTYLSKGPQTKWYTKKEPFSGPIGLSTICLR